MTTDELYIRIVDHLIDTMHDMTTANELCGEGIAYYAAAAHYREIIRHMVFTAGLFAEPMSINHEKIAEGVFKKLVKRLEEQSNEESTRK